MSAARKNLPFATPSGARHPHGPAVTPGTAAGSGMRPRSRQKKRFRYIAGASPVQRLKAR